MRICSGERSQSRPAGHPSEAEGGDMVGEAEVCWVGDAPGGVTDVEVVVDGSLARVVVGLGRVGGWCELMMMMTTPPPLGQYERSSDFLFSVQWCGVGEWGDDDDCDAAPPLGHERLKWPRPSTPS